MDIGLCLTYQQFDILKDVNVKHIELNARNVESLSDEEFSDLKAIIKRENYIITAANCLLPAGYVITNEGYDLDLLMNFIKKVVSRLSECNCPIIVFGSSDARNLDEGYGIEKGKKQFFEFLNSLLDLMEQYNMKLAIEPLNKRATNYINTLTEGYQVAKNTNSDRCGVLCDYYHLMSDNEPLSNLNKVKDKLIHCHIAAPKTRTAPQPSDLVDYKSFVDKLKEINYNGNISIEGKLPDNKDLDLSIEYLRSLL